MKVLVTGGAGFIGSYLCEELLKRHKVVCVDNLSAADKSNIAHLTDNPDFEFIQHDITKPLVVADCDYIMHFASRPSPVDYQKNPVETALVGSLGTYHMLELAKKNKCEIMFASTSEVYGDPEEHPQRESYRGNVSITGPRACYDESKRFSEALMFAYKKQFGVKIKIVRIFNTYGPRMRKNDGRVIPAFISQCLANKPITVFGDGKQTRSFCFITDLVSGILKFMESDHTGPMNLGNPDEHTILELAYTIKKLTGSNSEVVFKSLPKDDPVKRQPDISFAKQILSWEPEVDLEQGLKETIRYFSG